jgi:leucyl/phenylalanyl-tRNA---protein transferase
LNKILILKPQDPFPPVASAWDAASPAPGLLAAGGSLDVATLCKAYQQGIFPWFSQGQPILWWSPDPRMVLQTSQFRLHASLRKTIQKFVRTEGLSIRFDTAFDTVIRACANRPAKQNPGAQATEAENVGTWILPPMVQAYIALHHAGFAHSVETWVGDQLVGGLYCVAVGQAVFGESMFSHRTDASKIALAALVAFCRAKGIKQIDCQQNTRHLASLGAAEMHRSDFLAAIEQAQTLPTPRWEFDTLYWQNLLQTASPSEPQTSRTTL